MKTKFLTVVLGISLIATLFVGCSSSNDKMSNNTNTEINVSEKETVNTEIPVTETENVEMEDNYFTITLNGNKLNFLTSSKSDFIAALGEEVRLKSDDSGKSGSFYFGQENLGKYEDETVNFFFVQFADSQTLSFYNDITFENTCSEIRELWGEPDYFYHTVPGLGNHILFDYYISEDGKHILCIEYTDLKFFQQWVEPLETIDLLPIGNIYYTYNEKGLELFESILVDGTNNQIKREYTYRQFY